MTPIHPRSKLRGVLEGVGINSGSKIRNFLTFSTAYDTVFLHILIVKNKKGGMHEYKREADQRLSYF